MKVQRDSKGSVYLLVITEDEELDCGIEVWRNVAREILGPGYRIFQGALSKTTAFTRRPPVAGDPARCRAEEVTTPGWQSPDPDPDPDPEDCRPRAPEKAPAHSGCLGFFPRALQAIAELSAQGTKKHGGPVCFDRKSTDPEDYRESLSRHVLAGAIDPYNEEDAVDHDLQIAWNALAVVELRFRQQETGNE